jgi:c-di-GMP-binding flagellar brake protein YcgR
MTSVPGVDYPEEQREAGVTLLGRGISVDARVEFVNLDERVVVVRPSVSDHVRQVVVAAGNEVEVVWGGPEDQRMVPATVQAVESGAVIRWRLVMTGEAEVSQRRKAVRARVAVPIQARFGSVELNGESVDLSRNGMRATVDGFGIPPEPGATLDLVITLDDGPVTVEAEVIRQQSRGARWLMSLRFLDLEEREGDRLRRLVFQALHEERARTAD